MPRLPFEQLEGKEQDKEGLDNYLSKKGFKKNPFEAEVLRARQEASETPLGSMLGLQPMNEQEKVTYQANRDPAMEEAMDRAQQFGMATGTLNTMAPKVLQALKGSAFTGAAREAQPLAKEANMVAARPQGLAEEVPEEVIQQMLKQRKDEVIANRLAKLEAEYADPATTGKAAQKLGQEITRLKNYNFRTFKK